MSYPVWYTRRIKNMKKNKMNFWRRDARIKKIIKEKENRDEITFHGFVSEDNETYCGCDTITAPDGKEYPIRDND